MNDHVRDGGQKIDAHKPSRTFATTDAGWHTLARAGFHLLAFATFQERT